MSGQTSALRVIKNSGRCGERVLKRKKDEEGEHMLGIRTMSVFSFMNVVIRLN